MGRRVVGGLGRLGEQRELRGERGQGGTRRVGGWIDSSRSGGAGPEADGGTVLNRGCQSAIETFEARELGWRLRKWRSRLFRKIGRPVGVVDAGRRTPRGWRGKAGGGQLAHWKLWGGGGRGWRRPALWEDVLLAGGFLFEQAPGHQLFFRVRLDQFLKEVPGRFAAWRGLLGQPAVERRLPDDGSQRQRLG